MDIDDIVKTLKETEWEEESKATILSLRYTIAASKISILGQIAIPKLKQLLRDQLIGKNGHAKDKLAARLFDHYLYKGGATYQLSMEDMNLMNTRISTHIGPIDIRKYSYQSPAIKPEWHAAIAKAKVTKKAQKYSGSLLWVWDNGAIANYTVKYTGSASVSRKGVVKWEGHAQFIDRFDMDPRWNWSESTPGGRSRGGERRTRIGYMLNLGDDFDIRSMNASAIQLASVKYIEFRGAGHILVPTKSRSTDSVF